MGFTGVGTAVKMGRGMPGLDRHDSAGFQGLGRTSLVVQWLRLLAGMQGTWVQSLVGEDPTCLVV